MSSSAGGNPLEHLLYEVHILIPEIENKEGIWPFTVVQLILISI